ncbi:DNA-binding NarL/FixJ family response regulator [Algoriphagus sp. 4150]|uniref:response regulator transcription factor n=1 Tax=Algoriphagus sp. 4150 TaxID=2817756 RepID=UPI00285B7B71|nr:response regulator transcription factor [Algoriphagus sp. 4150]MDR7131457.1 DNA-binding NarL/FixJ family response regulator [Algoriphagus sp. 4150]
MIKIYITDDHPIVLGGLKNLIESKEGMQLLGLFSNANDTLIALKIEVPDLILLDINLPDTSGIELSKQLRESYPDLKIIILSVHNEKAVIGSALQNKVNGYVLKNSLGDQIIDAIHQVMNGELYLCEQSKAIYYNSDASEPNTIPIVTRREKEILKLIANGKTSTQIADQLFISPHTVESHRKNLIEKFGANGMSTVIKLATEYNLI